MSAVNAMWVSSLLVVLATGAYCASAPILKVDGVILITNPAPLIHNGRMYVPISIFQGSAFRDIGLNVKWKKGEKSGMIYWEDSDLIYDVTAGQSWVPGPVAGSRIKLPGTPLMLGDQLMVPLRTPVWDTPSARDFQIQWDARNHVANVVRSRARLQRRRNARQACILRLSYRLVRHGAPPTQHHLLLTHNVPHAQEVAVAKRNGRWIVGKDKIVTI